MTRGTCRRHLSFRSEVVSKSNVVDHMVQRNSVLYAPGEEPDHCKVIRYVPCVGHSKHALDKCTLELMLGGTNSLVRHNTCEASLLHAELAEPQTFHPVLSRLSFLFKVLLMPLASPVV
ncbi:Inositol-3-phosphate synthase 1 [Saguinus oedipus]|uniref:Inositol-3-phosphate synthase 1 n=1 Tax=Saguinus oedipus TaxID=9490 RepID=A0ABQ9W3D2_SAGOE|nr:Inositol-3-phosphate synthase 1 [Saguinus oedipus]